MTGRNYLIWFLAVVVLSVAAMATFNAVADAYILSHDSGKSVQTVSGFERVLKPAWLDSIKPDWVFAGSSRMREGFDPALIDPAFHVRSFNYGFSSITAYEARRLIQDSAAQPSVKKIFMSMDAFAGGSAAQPVGSGFDELRLAVTADGTPTPRRQLWLATTRYLSGGALGMHALSLYLMLQLKPGETAEKRPDLFTAYSVMTYEGYQKDKAFRFSRTMTLSPWQRQEFETALKAVCDTTKQTYFFFPPDNHSVLARYIANDASGLAKFKRAAVEDVRAHNAVCRGKVALFDFLNVNALTQDSAAPEFPAAFYLDLIHFRPRVGLLITKRMLGADFNVGVDLLAAQKAPTVKKANAG